MKPLHWHTLKVLVTAIAVTLFFSCKNDFGEVQKIGQLQNQPIGEAENIDLVYTEINSDSLEVHLLANLISPKMLDYSNRDFPFSEFPDGIKLKMYDDNGKMTTITSDYAIVYNETDMIDLRGDVVIATHDKDTLFTEQLYYNQKLEWVFTDLPIYFKQKVGFTKGNGFDSNKNFQNYKIDIMKGDFEFDN